MTSWQITQPQCLDVPGEVARIEVWLAHGRLRVVGAETPGATPVPGAVASAASGAARVEVKKVGRRGITVTHEGGVLTVRHNLRPGWRHWAGPMWWFTTGMQRYTADLTIAVPPTAVGALTVVSGSVVASGLRHGASLDVTSGSITLMGLGGTVRAKTISGSIEALGVGGDLSVQTVSGEISLADSSAQRVRARTISGSVTADLDNPDARDVRIDTTSGSITVRVPRDADLDVNLHAVSGRVTSAFEQVRGAGLPGTSYARGRLGSGAGTLHAYAVSGSVSLLARPVPDDSFVEPARTDEPDERARSGESG